MHAPLPTKNLREKINWLEREQIVNLLHAASIQSFDNESTRELREALAVNVEDGTIPEDLIPDD